MEYRRFQLTADAAVTRLMQLWGPAGKPAIPQAACPADAVPSIGRGHLNSYDDEAAAFCRIWLWFALHARCLEQLSEYEFIGYSEPIGPIQGASEQKVEPAIFRPRKGERHMPSETCRPASRAAVALVMAMAAVPAAAQDLAIARTADDPSLEWGGCPDFMPEGCEIAVLHGDPAEPNADILFRVPGGAEIARHWHNSPERMVLVSGEMRVDYDGQDPVTLAPGTYAYGPARKPHSATCLSAVPCTLFIAFVDPVDALEGEP